MSLDGAVTNTALARVRALVENVQTQTPSTSRLELMALAATGIEDNAVLVTKTSVADLLSGSTNESTNTNYSRIVFTHSDLPAVAPDQVNNWLILNTLANHGWTNIGSAVTVEDAIAKLVISYVPVIASSTDSDRIPLTIHDFPIQPNGNNITIDFEGYFKAFAQEI